VILDGELILVGAALQRCDKIFISKPGFSPFVDSLSGKKFFRSTALSHRR
jgi:hypothetical protein